MIDEAISCSPFLFYFSILYSTKRTISRSQVGDETRLHNHVMALQSLLMGQKNFQTKIRIGFFLTDDKTFSGPLDLIIRDSK